MSQAEVVTSNDVSSSFWHVNMNHIIWAAIFCLLAELLRNILNMRKRLKKRDSSLWLYTKEFLKRKFSGDRSKPLNKREIDRSIESNLANLDKASVVFSIDKKGVLTNKDKSHYKINGYHFARFLNVLPILDGGELFFVEACRSIGEILRTREIDCLLYLDKDSDSIFCREVCIQSLPERIKVFGLGYKNNKVIYRENESLDGQNVAILTALALNEKPLINLAKFVRSKGAHLVSVAILFDTISKIVDLQTFIGAPVTSAISVDLKHCKSDQCSWCPTKPKVEKLEFNDY
jgi:hypothetical protein